MAVRKETFPPAIMRSQIISSVLRASVRPTVARSVLPTVARTRLYSDHPQETFESFTERYVDFFNKAEDIFEVQRGLNNCFAHDLVPAPSVIEAAVRASRRVDDFATAVRVFNGVKVKVENKKQYQDYVDELKGLREELGAFFLTLRAFFSSDTACFRDNIRRRALPRMGEVNISIHSAFPLLVLFVSLPLTWCSDRRPLRRSQNDDDASLVVLMVFSLVFRAVETLSNTNPRPCHSLQYIASVICNTLHMLH